MSGRYGLWTFTDLLDEFSRARTMRDLETHPVAKQGWTLRCGELEREIAVRNVRMTQGNESANPPKINWYNARIAAVKILACCEDAAFCSPAVFDEHANIRSVHDRLNEIAAALHILPGGAS